MTSPDPTAGKRTASSVASGKNTDNGGDSKRSKQSTLLSHFNGRFKTPAASSAPIEISSGSIPSGSLSNSTTSSSPSAVDISVAHAKVERLVVKRPRLSMQELLQGVDHDLFALEIAHLGADWLPYLADQLKKPYFRALKEFIRLEEQTKRVIYPPSPLIYQWAKLCPLESCKVVIIGQDPYHNDHQAMGLCFAVPKHMRVLPPSLINIYKELSSDLGTESFTIPTHGDLSSWAQQGVMLLNTSLTVRAHEAASHAGKGWEQFTP